MGGSLGRSTLRIPDVEAADVELERAPLPIEGDAFDEPLILGDGRFARIARFAVAGTAPDAGDAVVWEPTIGEFGANEETKGFCFHGGSLG
jgi:hypothetical protein